MSETRAPHEWTIAVACGDEQVGRLLEKLKRNGFDPVVLPGAATSLIARASEAPDRAGLAPTHDGHGPAPDGAGGRAASPLADHAELVWKLNDAQRTAGIGSWDWDVRANTVWWSDETYRIFGVSRATYLPTVESNASFVHPGDRAAFHEAAFRALETGAPFDTDLRIVTPDGALKFCHFRATVHRGDDGIVSRFSGTIADITDRRRAEDALRRSEGKYRKLFTETPDGCALHEVICDQAGRPVDYVTLEVNAAYERLLNVRAEVVVGRRASNPPGR